MAAAVFSGMVALPLQAHETFPETCATCRQDCDARRSLHYVPWGDRMAAGRWLCFDCLLTLFRLDTQTLMEQRRSGRTRLRIAN